MYYSLDWKLEQIKVCTGKQPNAQNATEFSP